MEPTTNQPLQSIHHTLYQSWYQTGAIQHSLNLFPNPLQRMISIFYIKLPDSQQQMRKWPLLFGMFTKEWPCLQYLYLKRNLSPYDKQQARIGLLQIGLLLAKMLKKLWDLRNHDCYVPPSKQVPSYQQLMLLTIVKSLYELKPHILSLDKATFFSILFSNRHTHSNQQLQSYSNYYKKLIHDSIKQAADMGANFRQIYNYFRINPE